MVFWYSKGQSQYTEGNFHMAYYIDMNGYNENNYDSQDIQGDGESGDPFMAFGIDTETWVYGQGQVEIGLLVSNRIKINASGYWYWDGDSFEDLITAVGPHDLDSHSDVIITTPADNEVLAWDNATTKWINQTPAEAGLQPAGSYLENIVEDISPQFGGNVDGNTKTLTNIKKITISSDIDGKLELQTTTDGGTPGTPEGGWNYIEFLDSDGDRQGYFGIDDAGNFQFSPEVAGAKIEMGAEVNLLTHKIINLVNGVGAQDAMAFGQKYTLEQHDNTYHSTNYLANVVGDASPQLAADLDCQGWDIEKAGTVYHTDATRWLARISSNGFDTGTLYDIGIKWDTGTNKQLEVVGYNNLYLGIHTDHDIVDINASGMRIGGTNARINEISTDGTLGGNSDVAVPTEKAVKTYADTKVTPAGARTALGSVIDSNGHLDKDLDCDGFGIIDCDRVHFRDNVNAEITLEDHFTTDHRYHGIVVDITCAVAFGLPVYISGNNTVAQADADQLTTMPCIGISVGTNKVLIMGVVYDLTYAFVNGNPVYVTSTGILDDAIPTGVGDIVQVVGVAIDADTLLVNPSLDWVKRK